jgi:hypothetical protein
MAERVLAGFFIVFSVFFFIIALQMTPPKVDTPLVGSFWPGLALAILFVCSCIELVRLLRQTKEERQAKEAADDKKKKAFQEAMGEADNRSLLIFGGVIAFLYIFTVHYIGFIITTPVFMAVYMYVTGYRNKVMLVAAPLLAIVVFLLLFVVATYIPLPRGMGIFQELSQLLY